MFETVVVGANDSSTARRAVEAAAGVCAQFQGQLHVVSAYRGTRVALNQLPSEYAAMGSLSDAEALLQEFTFIAQRHGVTATAHGVEGDAVQAILQTARNVGAALIVVGNQGMRGARRVLGSVPNSIAHEAPCSVLIVDTSD